MNCILLFTNKYDVLIKKYINKYIRLLNLSIEKLIK